MNSTIIHERPGVYSSYDASVAVGSGNAGKGIAIAAYAKKGTEDGVKRLTSYASCVAAFGDGCAMTEMLRLAYLNGAAEVIAAAVPESADAEQYKAAFDLLETEEGIGVMLCDSEDAAVWSLLQESVERAALARRERIAVVGVSGKTVGELTACAKALNSERMVLVGGEGLNVNGDRVGGAVTSAAVGALIAATNDPALPLNGARLQGLYGVADLYSDGEIDLLVRGGVTPIEAIAGEVSVVRGITTRTQTSDAPDTTWRELTTILIVDDVIGTLRSVLRSKFVRAKNTTQTRSAIRSQVIVELESKRRAQIIDDFGDVSVQPSEEDATVCEVEFSFSVVGGLNRIYLTAHITV